MVLLQEGEVTVSLVYFKNHIFLVCTSVNSDPIYGLSFIWGSHSGNVNYIYTSE